MVFFFLSTFQKLSFKSMFAGNFKSCYPYLIIAQITILTWFYVNPLRCFIEQFLFSD